MMQQNQMSSLMQREQYLGTSHVTHQPMYNNESMRSTHRSNNYVNRGLSLTTNAYRQPTNKLVYNPNYGEVQIPLNEPLIVSNRSDYVAVSMRALPPAATRSGSSRRNSFRSLKNHNRSLVLSSTDELNNLNVIELDSTDDLDEILSQRSRGVKSSKSVSELIEEKIEQEVERRVKEEVARELNKQKSILKEKSLRFD